MSRGKITIDYDVAVKYGPDAAIFLEHLRGWIDYNKKHGQNFRDGRTWMYNTVCRKKFNNSSFEAVGDIKVRSLEESLPFWTANQIRYIVDKLVEQKVIITTDKYNKFKNDRKLWYAFANEQDWFDTNTRLEATEETDESGLGNFPDQKEVDLFTPPKEAENAVEESSTLNFPTPNDSWTGNFPSEAGKIPNSELGNFRAHKKDSNKQTNEEEKEPVSTFELLFNKTAIKAYVDGTCEKLAFDFNNIELVNKNIERLFRMFAGIDSPNPVHVDQIRNELLNDARMELSYKVCWVIIQLAFMEYPGAEKKYQNVNSLLRKIGWKKDDFAKDLPTYLKQQETYLARQKQKDVQQKTKEQELAQMLEWTKTKLAEHHNILTAAEMNEINKMLRENKVMSAKGQLEYYLYDVHKLEEAAA